MSKTKQNPKTDCDSKAIKDLMDSLENALSAFEKKKHELEKCNENYYKYILGEIIQLFLSCKNHDEKNSIFITDLLTKLHIDSPSQYANIDIIDIAKLKGIISSCCGINSKVSIMKPIPKMPNSTISSVTFVKPSTTKTSGSQTPKPSESKSNESSVPSMISNLIPPKPLDRISHIIVPEKPISLTEETNTAKTKKDCCENNKNMPTLNGTYVELLEDGKTIDSKTKEMNFDDILQKIKNLSKEIYDYK